MSCHLVYATTIRDDSFTTDLEHQLFVVSIGIYAVAVTLTLFYLQVSDRCREGGPISPSKCVYMKEWLSEL